MIEKCKKVTYYNVKQANKACENAANQEWAMHWRAYKCQKCELYHVTKQYVRTKRVKYKRSIDPLADALWSSPV